MRTIKTNRLDQLRPLVFAMAVAVVTAACSAAAGSTSAPTHAPAPAAPTDEASAEAGADIASALVSGTADETLPRPAPELVGLVNADGTAFDLADHAGADTLIFFGYTHCPDVCPTTIGEIFQVFEAAPATHAIFISVDPERDTPEFLDAWTEYFPDQFNAVTGSPGAIRRAADNYDVKYARVETTSTAGYTMSHTADLYLIDEAGQLRQIYPFGTPAEDIVADLGDGRAGQAGDTSDEGVDP